MLGVFVRRSLDLGRCLPFLPEAPWLLGPLTREQAGIAGIVVEAAVAIMSYALRLPVFSATIGDDLAVVAVVLLVALELWPFIKAWR